MDESRERARSMILFRFVTRVSSTLSTLIVALHGPTRSIVSRAAARIEVSTWSSEDGIRVVPSVRPFLLWTSTSIRPMRPLFCRSRKSSCSPRSPSVWPTTAPTTSRFSTFPSASRRAWMRYLVVLGSMFIFALVRASRQIRGLRPAIRTTLGPAGHFGLAVLEAGKDDSDEWDLGIAAFTAIPIPNWVRAYLRVRANILTFGNVGAYRAFGPGPRTIASMGAGDNPPTRAPRRARRIRGAIRRL